MTTKPPNQFPSTPDSTLAEARDAVTVGRNTNQGIICPCCMQFVKTYRRALTDTMAAGLIAFYKAVGDSGEYFHLLTLAGDRAANVRYWRCGGFAKLRYWGLMEGDPTAKGKKNSGFWRITEKGRQFVEKTIQLPKAVYVFIGNVINIEGVEEPLVDIKQCLKKKFSYDELMSTGPDWGRARTAEGL